MPTRRRKAVYKIGLNRSSSLRIAAYGVILFFLGWGIFAGFTGRNTIATPSEVLSLLVFAAAIIIHEAIHGLFFWVFGGRPKFGVGITNYMPYAFATAPGQPYTLVQMLIIRTITILPSLSVNPVARCFTSPASQPTFSCVFRQLYWSNRRHMALQPSSSVCSL